MPDMLSIRPPTSIPPLAVGLPDAARLIGLSERTVRDLVRSGEIRAIQPGGHGGKLLFRVAALDQWLIEMESRPCDAAEGGCS